MQSACPAALVLPPRSYPMRQALHSFSLPLPPNHSYSMRQALHSFSVLDHLLAVGGQGEIFFWDRRAPAAPVLKLPDTHMDEVTQVGGGEVSHRRGAGGPMRSGGFS